MTVGELITELQKLCPEHENDYVFSESRTYNGDLDLVGDPVSHDFNSVRVESNGAKGKKHKYCIILY